MNTQDGQKLIIVTAPSGAGKSTIVKYLLEKFTSLQFSVSACTRGPRNGEIDGVHYHFISTETFENHIAQNHFLEYEMVYKGKYYGTLYSELDKIFAKQHVPLLDIDVYGAMRILEKKQYKTLSIFIKAPDIHTLEQRLRNRATETEQSLTERILKAKEELQYEHKFDVCIINDKIDIAVQEAIQKVENFLNT